MSAVKKEPIEIPSLEKELMNWLEPPYTLKREDNKDARFYWLKVAEKTYKKYVGITSLSDKVVPKTEELFRWKIQEDPDGRLVELAAETGTVLHLCADAFDKGEDWSVFMPENYRYSRLIMGGMLSWHVFRKQYGAVVVASELMLKYEDPQDPTKCYANALDKVMWIRELVKVDVEETVHKANWTRIKIEDGVYLKGDKKGQIKYKFKSVNDPVPVTKIVKKEAWVWSLAIVDLKSNFFDKDKKNFYEAHRFQLEGQRRAFMQAFPDLPKPRIFNWAPNSWRARSSGSYDNMYTLKEWTDDYSADFDEYLNKAHRKGYLSPNGKAEVFFPFNAETPIEDAYKVFNYDQYIEYMESQRHTLNEDKKDMVFKESQLQLNL